MNSKLGTLTRVDIREIWTNEEHDFTPWLAKSENITQLGNELGIEIDSIQTEAKIGKYKLDILANESNTENKVIIENQLEPSDHSHLGQLITYASGTEATYIIWIVRDANEEHIKAIDWLNEHTDENIGFFLVQVEAWKIGESEPAPKFSIISRPNDWAKTIKGSMQEGELSGTKSMQLQFWHDLKSFCENKYNNKLKCRKPLPKHWYDISIGKSSCHLSFITDTRDNRLRCELYIHDNKALFKHLEKYKDQIEKELDMESKLEWQLLPEKKASRILAQIPFNFTKDDWEEGFTWLIENGIAFEKVLKKYIDI